MLAGERLALLKQIQILKKEVSERESLRELGEELERRIRHWHRELARTNAALKNEIKVRKKSEEKFRQVADTVGGVIIVHRLEKFLYVNRASEVLTGYSRDELLSMNYWEIAAPKFRHLLRRRAQQRTSGATVPSKYEIQIITKQGVLRWLYLSVSIIDYEGKPAILGTGYDVTERKQAEEELKRAKFIADAANRAKSEFLSNISHEIRTPIGAILGYAELIQRLGNSEENKYYADAIRRNGRHLLELVDDLLDLSAIEAGKININLVRIPLKQEVDSIITMMRQKAAQKKLKLSVEWKDNIPSFISCDPTRLRQLLINIVGNAIKFTNQGEIVLIIRLSSRLEDGKRLIEFVVKDSGIGIPPNLHEELFRPFSRVDNSFSRRFSGTGLGLVLSRRLAEALGGDVRLANSEPNLGSTFVISIDPGSTGNFPEALEAVPTFVTSDAALDVCLDPCALAGINVLLVEDGVDNQLLFKKFLTDAGASVSIAEDGNAAIELAMTDYFDVILMDIQLPLLDGYQATAYLRKRGYFRPIVALTAHAMAEECSRCIEVGCDEALTKPIDATSLIGKTAKWGEVAHQRMACL